MFLQNDALFVLTLALVLDALIGDPDWLWRRLSHPVVWIGSAISMLDVRLNKTRDSAYERKLAGVLAVLFLVAGALLVAGILRLALNLLPAGLLLESLLVSTLIAQRSLWQHVGRVGAALTTGGLVEGRKAVAMIVGRNPDSLDDAGVCRAAIESTAENFADGIVAPAFWFALFGLPGLIVCKTINTADSMIGHRTQRHAAFGWAAARLDDLVNLVPARLAGVLLALCAPRVGGGAVHSLTIMWRDAGLHRSPNAGWPESAMAAGLGIALGGPRRYGEELVDEPFLNGGMRALVRPADIGRAMHVMAAACLLQFLIVCALVLATV